MSFLMGLNESYAQMRGQLLLMDPLSSINKVFFLDYPKTKAQEGWLTIDLRDRII